MFPSVIKQLDIESACSQWSAAQPFPHIVLDDFLSDPIAVRDAFPTKDWKHWNSLGDSYQWNKYSCSVLEVIPSQIQEVIRYLNEPQFLLSLESITSIRGLIPDPYLEGGGLHLSLEGGILAPHSDFHVYGRLNLYRRLNLIIYLNSHWRAGDGGELELSLPNDIAPRQLIEPSLNRAVLFETNDTSIHGFTRPVRESTERRSIALYYYTAIETNKYSGDQTTHWRSHGALQLSKKPQLWIYQVLMKISRLFSITAQLINPNQGARLAITRLRQARALRDRKRNQ